MGQLLEEERVALGPVDNEIRECRWDVDVEHGPHDVHAVLTREGRQGDLGHVRTMNPGLPVPGPVCQENEDRQCVDAVEEGESECLGRGVHPVQVLDDDDQWPAPGRAHIELPDDVADPGLDDLRGQNRCLFALLDPEELEQ
jgi:hypothetical protein